MEDGTPNLPNPVILMNFSIETHHCGDPILRKKPFLVNIQKTMERSTMLLMGKSTNEIMFTRGYTSSFWDHPTPDNFSIHTFQLQTHRRPWDGTYL
jgi:hypothetical protein